MQRIIFLLVFLVNTFFLSGQSLNSSHRIMAFDKWQPALVTLTNGKSVTVGQANIFLKKSSLVYRGRLGKTMEAKMSIIESVRFKEREYVRIDTLLAWKVDSVGQNVLYCASVIDMSSVKNNIINSRTMTDVELSFSMVNSTTLDVEMEDIEWPIINRYFFLYNGKLFQAQEREVSRHLPKSQLHNYRVAISLAEFSWTDPEQLLSLLKRISGE